jgi:hypothetical protein
VDFLANIAPLQVWDDFVQRTASRVGIAHNMAIFLGIPSNMTCIRHVIHLRAKLAHDALSKKWIHLPTHVVTLP